MIQRRLFLKHMAGVAASALLAGCGGGGKDSGETGTVVIEPETAAPPSPAPTPAPVTSAPPPPVSDNPVVDAAEADITARFAGLFAGFAATDRFDDVRTIASADQFAAFFETIRVAADPQDTLRRRTRIVCDWDGVSTLAADAGVRLGAGNITQRSDGHLDHGGGILVMAATGRRPAFGNQIDLSGTRGIHFDGIDFFRQRVGDENADTAYAANLTSSATYPSKPVVLFTNCRFGARHVQPSLPQSQWICAINTAGVPAYVGLIGCSFNGHPTVAKLAVRHLRVDRCDFTANRRDVFALYSHTGDSGYHAMVWISRSTFRAGADSWESRNEHRDVVQTCTPADRHLGYRCLFTDLVAHHNHSYAGDPGAGGGSQGFFNRGYPDRTFDNQFVMRRCIVLVSSPHAFAYHATSPTWPSYVDQCTFMRCGSVPSGLAGDVNPAQDFSMGLTASVAGVTAPTLFVSRTYGMDLRSEKDARTNVSMVEVDPRNRAGVPDEQRPESRFRGRDFSRGGRPANYTSGKFGYVLPREAENPARFLDDIWANFEPLGGFAGTGAPDPRGLL